MAMVLVVDDDASIRIMVQTILRSAGYQVQSARDGQEALELWAATPADLIVLDLNMPRLPGWDVCQQIRAISTVPILIMTGQAVTRCGILSTLILVTFSVAHPRESVCCHGWR